jgi:hypothetical protein
MKKYLPYKIVLRNQAYTIVSLGILIYFKMYKNIESCYSNAIILNQIKQDDI